MPLFKTVKKLEIKATAGSGGQISPLRPAYKPKAPPCSGGCPSGADIRGWLTTIAQAEAYGRSNDEAYRMAWGIITDRNPFPAVCGRVSGPAARAIAQGASAGPFPFIGPAARCPCNRQAAFDRRHRHIWEKSPNWTPCHSRPSQSLNHTSTRRRAML